MSEASVSTQARPRRRLGVWLASVLGAGLLAWLAARRLPLWPERWAPVDTGWLAIALALSLPYMWTRAHRMAPLLAVQVAAADPGARPRNRWIHGTGLASFLIVLLLPLRLGEFSRPILIARDETPGVGFEEALGAQALERILDGLCVVGLLFLGLALSTPDDANLEAVQRIGQITGAVFGIAALVGLWLSRVPGRVERWVEALMPAAVATRLAPAAGRIAKSLGPLWQWRSGLPFAAWTVAYWAITVAQLWALARAFDLPLDLAAAAACVAIVGLSIQLPGGPAQLGSFQVGMATALSLYLPAAAIEGAGASFAVAMYALTLAVAFVGGAIGAISLASVRRVGPVRRADSAR